VAVVLLLLIAVNDKSVMAPSIIIFILSLLKKHIYSKATALGTAGIDSLQYTINTGG
jgi:hypothetical protein